ncbi:MAG: [protein-PII] uridylyltransferase [Gammaproteobacteria bacterium]|nr:[protein-PII] uridylyltransferase [Gammaproteobacteria bacterium]
MNTAPEFFPPLIDESDFLGQLQESKSPLPLFRDAIKRGNERLKTLFNQGETMTQLVKQRAGLIDFLLLQAWSRMIPEDAEASLVAVGGYGRGELHPASDIDLLILLGDGETETLSESLGALITFLWDIGLEVGHSVRTVQECVAEAKLDITVITSLMEARALFGPIYLFEKLKRAIATDKMWPSDRFFEAKQEEQNKRYQKYEDTVSSLEPNLKEGPGGLRDIQTIDWVVKRHFDADRMSDLVTHGFLTETEYWDLKFGQDWLWRIRFALHLHTGRCEDRLLFDHQKTLADQFGFQDDHAGLGIEKFMQEYYQTAIRINRMNEMLLQHFREVIVLKCHLEDPKPLNKRFQSRSGFLEVVDDQVFEKHPLAMLELFLIMEQHPGLNGVRASTIRLIRDQRRTIDHKFRASPEARAMFMAILRQGQGITSELRRMNRYGILSRYIPAFANIVGRMQYDLFHVYTVDEHTLFVVRNLRRFMIAEHRNEFPLCSEIIEKLYYPELLFLAALFHDIAKGRGGDHSTLGAEEAYRFCRLHKLSDRDSLLVSWLVKHHLIMSMTAQRKDISDPEVIGDFARIVGNPVRLDYLYLLTIADIRATDPKKWNNWKNSLLRELYNVTKQALLRGLQNPQERDEIIQNKQSGALHLLKSDGFEREQVIQYWLTLSLDYFLYYSWEEIAWQTKLVLTAKPDALPLVVLRNSAIRGGTEVFTYIEDRQALFAQTTSLLDRLGLNIVSARIETTDTQLTINSFLVLEEDGSPVEDPVRKEKIMQTLKNALKEPASSDIRVLRRVPRQLKHFSIPTRVDFAQDPANHRTIMKLNTDDRPGLLSQVGYAFAENGIRLISAKIATIGAEVDDTFFISDQENRPLAERETFERLEKAIHDRLDSKTDKK